MPGSEKNTQKTVNLALQGGGAHGAFTWGVLDKMLEDGRIAPEGICATSAGSMNACAMAYGLHLGGRDQARAVLHDFWHRIHRQGFFLNPVRQFPLEKTLGWNMDHSPAYFLFDTMTRLFSPYQLNPLDINPLRDVLEDVIDFDALRRCDRVKLFISATHVRTGKVRVFENNEITADAVMASACLPFMFKAVEIDGEHYWDGGYVGNPALYPLFYKTCCDDIMIVHINPLDRDQLPTTAPDIMNRINEISFNDSLLKELRAVAFVKKLVEHDMLHDEYKDNFKDILVHSIRDDESMGSLSVASKFNSDWDFLTHLRDIGRAAMEKWLARHYDDVGVRGTVDLHHEFLTSVTDMFAADGRIRKKKES